jgi:putative methyltransferase (TIGR04325 family)
MFFKKKEKKNQELPYGWSGHYKNWQEALSLTKGYDASAILEKVKSAVLKVKNGEAVYERDSVLFDKVQYSWPLLAILLRIAVENNNKLNIIDFGGSLGSSYFQNKNFLSGLTEIRWNVVEQKNFVATGKIFFSGEHLYFYDDIRTCTIETHSKILLASSSLQYLEDPFGMIKEIISLDFEYIILDRTAFINFDEHIITVQRVPPEIYEASYPAWFFNYEKLLTLFSEKYIVITRFDNGFTAPIKLNGTGASWSGIFFKRKSN